VFFPVLPENDITDVYKTFFEGTPNLTYLDLTGNQQLHLHENVFQNLTGLHQLILMDCGLVQLDAGLLAPLVSLERLNLHGNLLSDLPADVFRGQVRLTQLSLNKNQLRSLPAGIFDSLAAATLIEISHNQFKSLPADLFARNGNLTTFSLIVNGEYCRSDPADCHPELKLRYEYSAYKWLVNTYNGLICLIAVLHTECVKYYEYHKCKY
jgi:hypothetical protein